MDNFYFILFEAFQQFVPIKQCQKSTFSIWFSSELKNLIFRKKQAHKEFKQTRQEFDYSIFVNLRAQCKNLTELNYSYYISSAENSIIDNPKFFWQFVKSKNNDSSCPKVIKLDNDSTDNGVGISKLFAEYFASVYTKPIDFQEFDLLVTDDTFEHCSSISVGAAEVQEGMAGIDISKPMGPDGVPPLVFRNCSSSLYIPLFLLFDKSLQSGVFPPIWKKSYVVPVYKSGDRSDVRNYRPVSVLSSIPKLFEHCVECKLSHIYEKFIISQQHGFVSGRSVDTNLFLYANYISRVMEDGAEVHTVYTDFSKAFDRVDHSLLLRKLSCYGISGTLLTWIKSYLVDRCQQVKIENFLSKEICATSGVPQGSHLGPLFFNLFINDIGRGLRSRFLLFADDLKIFNRVAGDFDQKIIQDDINTVFNWCNSNGMSLNSDKCSVIQFSRLRSIQPINYSLNGVFLREVSVVKDLGVFFDAKFTFCEHYEKVIGRANRVLGFVKRTCVDFRDIGAIKTLYISYVRSIMEFSNIVWSPYFNSHIQRLENVQKKFLNFAKFKLFINGIDLSTDQIMQYLDLASLKSRREYYDVCFIFKILNYHICSPECLESVNIHVKSHSTRNTSLLHIPQCRTLYCLYNPINRMSRTVNKFCHRLEFFGKSMFSFKLSVKEIVLG